MGIGLVKGESSLFLKNELTENVYSPPTSGLDAVEVLEDGLELNYTRDEIERNILSSTIETEASRLGMKQLTGTIPVEYKANGSEGVAPRENVLYSSLMGGKRNLTAPVVTLTGHTLTEIFIDDADISKFKKNDIVLIKNPAKFEVRPIASVDETLGSAKIVLAIPLEKGVPVDNVEIAPFTVYYHQKGSNTFSATHFLGGQIKEVATGLRAVSATLENWSTAQVPSWSFAVEGLDLDRTVEAPAYQPDFSGSALPPVLINACIWFNGIHSDYSEFSLSIENTKAEILSACSASGKAGSRFTSFMVSGSFTPYMETDDVDRFSTFNQNDDVSIFGYAFNPTATGEFKDVVAFWLPQAKITEMPTGDQDGILTDSISFKAHRNEGNDTVFLGFI